MTGETPQLGAKPVPRTTLGGASRIFLRMVISPADLGDAIAAALRAALESFADDELAFLALAGKVEHPIRTVWRGR